MTSVERSPRTGVCSDLWFSSSRTVVGHVWHHFCPRQTWWSRWQTCFFSFFLSFFFFFFFLPMGLSKEAKSARMRCFVRLFQPWYVNRIVVLSAHSQCAPASLWGQVVCVCVCLCSWCARMWFVFLYWCDCCVICFTVFGMTAVHYQSLLATSSKAAMPFIVIQTSKKCQKNKSTIFKLWTGYCSL